MKILILHKWLVMGGAEKILINTLHSLVQLGNNVDLLLTYDLKEKNVFQAQIPDKVNCFFAFDEISYKKQEQYRLYKKKSVLKKIGYEIFKLNSQRNYKKTLFKMISNQKYDLIIDFSGCFDQGIRSSFLERSINTPIIRWIHGQLNGSNPITSKQYRKYLKIFSKHQFVISICEQMSEQLRLLFPDLPKERFYTLHNPINVNEIRIKSEQELSENIYYPYFLQVSRLVKGKGHKELIDIYAQLKNRGIKHKLYFMGDGENRTELEQKIKKLGLENDCLFLGEISNPYPYFKQASLFLHTSEHEGLPTVLLESMACGTPVIAMDCPTGPRDILGRNSEYGKLIAMHDKNSFCDAIVELLENQEKYQFYAEKSLERADDFSIENYLPKLEILLKNSLNNRTNGIPKP